MHGVDPQPRLRGSHQLKDIFQPIDEMELFGDFLTGIWLLALGRVSRRAKNQPFPTGGKNPWINQASIRFGQRDWTNHVFCPSKYPSAGMLALTWFEN